VFVPARDRFAAMLFAADSRAISASSPTRRMSPFTKRRDCPPNPPVGIRRAAPISFMIAARDARPISSPKTPIPRTSFSLGGVPDRIGPRSRSDKGKAMAVACEPSMPNGPRDARSRSHATRRFGPHLSSRSQREKVNFPFHAALTPSTMGW